MKSITLIDIEMSICKMIAEERRKNDREAGIVEEPLGPDHGADNDYYGFCAEFAVAKDLNIMPSFNTFVKSSSYDLISPKGSRIDVKHTCYENGRLIAPRFKTVDACDYYILVKGINPFYIMGWASSKELIQENNLQDLGYGLTYVLSNNELKDYK